jgi:hypothetical protein
MTSPFEFGTKLPVNRVAPKPAPGTPTQEAVTKLDAAAEGHGFVSREPMVRVERVRGGEPIDVLSVKGPLAVLNRFKRYCNETGLPYWRALDQMLRDRGA